MTLGDLLTVPSPRDVLNRLLALYKLSGFPTASWQPGSVARQLTEASSVVLADLSQLIATIAMGGFLDYAVGAWLDLLAASLFAEQRKRAGATRGLVRLTDTGGLGPVTILPGTYWVSNRLRTRRFRNIEGGTLPLGGTLVLTFEGESAGVAWSIGNDEIVELLTPGGTGIEVTNPAGASGTWITQQGADDEKDPPFRQRCRDKWATLGSGSNEAAYRYWATSSSSEVTRVRILGDPATGLVIVRVAGPAGPISIDALNQVSATVANKRPLTVGASIQNVLVQTITVGGTLYVAPGAIADDVLAAATSAVDAYAQEVDIGATVYRAQLIARLVDAVGARNVILTQPTDDVLLGADRVFVPTYSLTPAQLS